MQERGGACSLPAPHPVAKLMAAEFSCAIDLLFVTIFAIISYGILSSSAGSSFGDQTTKDGHRHLLSTHNYGLSSISTISSNEGIRAFLIHRPSMCSTLLAGTKLTGEVNVSKEAEQVEHLKCALQRSSSRVEFLLSRKSRDRATIPYGLPTRDVSVLEELDESETEDRFIRELVNSPEWEDSYESKVWSQPGEYFLTLEVGNPPRMLKAIVDTASDLTWLPCRPCAQCSEQSDSFQLRDSSTYRELDCAEEKCESLSTSFCNIFSDSCDYLYSYGDTSYIYGTLSSDTFTLRSTTIGQAREFPNIAFGCSHASRGTFTSTTDGVVALGRGAMSLASQLGARLSDKFGYCLVSRRNVTSATSPIYFGDAAVLTGSGSGYTPILTNERYGTYYYINMIGISVGGHRLNVSPNVFAIGDAGRGGTILDCGTTVTNLGGPAYNALADSFRTATEHSVSSSETGFDLCFNVGDNPQPQFPTLVFHLDGVDLDMPLENYMVEAEDRTMCLAVYRSPDSLNVIGNIQQQNFRVLYDRQNSRIGFQRTSCAAQ